MKSLLPFSWSNRSRADLADPFASLRQEVDRLFEDFGRFPGSPFQGTGGFGATPKVNVSESETTIDIEAELPGLDEKDVEVVLADNMLTIKGEKKEQREEKKKDFHVMERSYGSFVRSIPLPFAPASDAIKANFDKGVLTITLPKPKEMVSKATRIPIGRNGGTPV